MKLNSQARSLFLSLLATAALVACSDSEDPTPIPVVPKFTLVDVSNPIAITPDGKTALLEDLTNSLDGNLYSYDVATGALTPITQVGSPLSSFASGMSADGRISALYNAPNSDQTVAGIWTGSAWQTTASSFPAGCDNNINGAWDISQDGHVAVGFDWDGCDPKAMRWTEVAGTWTGTPLQVMGTGRSNRAVAVSGNGLVVGGTAETEVPSGGEVPYTIDRMPVVWQANGTGSFIPSGFDPTAPGEVFALNYDGSMMAGTWNNQGWYWTAATGTVEIGHLEGGFSLFPETRCTAIAANNKLIFGQSADQAFVWTKAAGTRNLQEIVTAAGLVIPEGITLTHAFAASADGQIVVGQAQDDQLKSFSYILELPLSSYRR